MHLFVTRPCLTTVMPCWWCACGSLLFAPDFILKCADGMTQFGRCATLPMTNWALFRRRSGGSSVVRLSVRDRRILFWRHDFQDGVVDVGVWFFSRSLSHSLFLSFSPLPLSLSSSLLLSFSLSGTYTICSSIRFTRSCGTNRTTSSVCSKI